MTTAWYDLQLEVGYSQAQVVVAPDAIQGVLVVPVLERLSAAALQVQTADSAELLLPTEIPAKKVVGCMQEVAAQRYGGRQRLAE
jgi:hypothetical protein